MKLSKKLFFMSFLTLILLLAGCSGNSSSSTSEKEDSGKKESSSKEDQIVLRGLTAWEEKNLDSQGFHVFKEVIEEASEGRIKVEYAGGPESIPPFNQGDAVSKGVVDFSVISNAYFTDMVPEGLVINYSELTAEEEMANGAWDYLNEIFHKKMNTHMAGRAHTQGYGLFLGNSVDKLNGIEDLKGLKIRGTPTYAPFITALGSEAIGMPTSEIYTALERGVIDGFGTPGVGMSFFSLQEQTKYRIMPHVNKVDAVFLFNLDLWEELPDDVKQLITDSMPEIEQKLDAFFVKALEEEAKKIEDAGVETVDLGDEFKELALEASWEWIRKELPENGEKLEELFRK